MKRSRINPINRERRAKLREKQFGADERARAIAWLRCACGGRHPACTGGWSEPSHVVSRGAGGTSRQILPMSTGCHRAWHQHGQATWMKAVGWTEADLARALERTNAELERRLDSEI